MSDRITWREGQYTFHAGYVAGIELFQIIWQSSPDKKNWALYGKLPGFKNDQGKSETLDGVKEQAEQVLVTFVERLGATYAVPPTAA